MAALTPENQRFSKMGKTDSKARVTLPKEFADSLVDIVQVDEFEVRIRKMATIPQREAWLWKNSKAITSVMLGLNEAKEREFADGPDVAADLAALEGED